MAASPRNGIDQPRPLAGAALIFWTVYRLQQDSVHRVRELEQSRAHLVEDSAARLRRIERDLHDGAQAQMVAVTMKLGLAMKKLGSMTDGTGQTDLDRVLELVAAAHGGAKEAITELRDLARGIHPPVLDQGLGIALTTLAARSDLPVELVIDLPERPSAAIETIAYFCAAELLANVPKHSGARHATLEAVHMPGLLRVRVSDDGRGGARVEARGGLVPAAHRERSRRRRCRGGTGVWDAACRGTGDLHRRAPALPTVLHGGCDLPEPGHDRAVTLQRLHRPGQRDHRSRPRSCRASVAAWHLPRGR